uniref:Uncharacterized protein n=1 Tax=Phakopsora pachyrhizi TaxID=170000 RepID=A0A0S1MIX9_PHAPC
MQTYLACTCMLALVTKPLGLALPSIVCVLLLNMPC